MLRDITAKSKSLLFKIRRVFLAWLEGFRLQTGWERGAAFAVGVLVLLSVGFYTYTFPLGLGHFWDVLVAVVLAAIGGWIVFWIGKWVLGGLFKLPVGLWVVIAIGIIVGLEVWGERTWLHWVFNLGLVGAAALAGIAVFALGRGEWHTALLRKKIFLSVMGVLGIGMLTWFGVLFFSPGDEAVHLPVQVALGAPALDSENPGESGPYSVQVLTYGSGLDKHRRAFGEQAALITDPVNAANYVSFSGFSARLMEFYWGFTETNLPLNGRVWYPEGEGPFPLVLIVHGNHNQVDFSDEGYAYLGELLASRGFIAVSVDENFL
ncbi:MAG: hypothetical protein P8046_11605, partial [Anaerolineales bacterium]